MAKQKKNSMSFKPKPWAGKDMGIEDDALIAPAAKKKPKKKPANSRRKAVRKTAKVRRVEVKDQALLEWVDNTGCSMKELLISQKAAWQKEVWIRRAMAGQ